MAVSSRRFMDRWAPGDPRPWRSLDSAGLTSEPRACPPTKGQAMNRIAGATHALLRIVAGLMFFCPGALKILGWFGGMPAGISLTPLTTAAGWIEMIAGP